MHLPLHPLHINAGCYMAQSLSILSSTAPPGSNRHTHKHARTRISSSRPPQEARGAGPELLGAHLRRPVQGAVGGQGRGAGRAGLSNALRRLRGRGGGGQTSRGRGGGEPVRIYQCVCVWTLCVVLAFRVCPLLPFCAWPTSRWMKGVLAQPRCFLRESLTSHRPLRCLPTWP